MKNNKPEHIEISPEAGKKFQKMLDEKEARWAYYRTPEYIEKVKKFLKENEKPR